MRFYGFAEKFIDLKGVDMSNTEDMEELFKRRRNKLQLIRDELDAIADFEDFEKAQICNLKPESKELAVLLIPSLQRFLSTDKEVLISKAIDVVQKSRE